MAQRKTKILFFSEAVTLAHITRPLALAQHLSSDQYEIYFAVREIPKVLQGISLPNVIHLQKSIEPKEFENCLKDGRLPFTPSVLTQQVTEDLQVLNRIKPDLVVGDFRLSLAISSKLHQVPYINISNLCWSPFAQQKTIVPDVSLRKTLGLPLTTAFFSLMKKRIYSKMAAPFNQVAKSFGLAKIADSILEVYCGGDYVLMADTQNLIEMAHVPENYIIAGPINFSLPIAVPASVTQLSDNRPIVFLSLGSSGPAENLELMIAKLATLPIHLIVSTAGKDLNVDQKFSSFTNVTIEKFLPIDELAKISDLVICSGGSATAYPCLNQATPVLAIPSNLDQFQFAQALAQKGLGRMLRPEDAIAGTKLVTTVSEMLKDISLQTAAYDFQQELKTYNTAEKFQSLIRSITQHEPSQQSEISKRQAQFTAPKILVTGASGFIGQHLKGRFPQATILNRTTHNVERVESLKALVQDVDVIVHLAATNAGTSLNPSVAELVDGNIFMTSQLLEAVRLYSTKKPKIIFMSTIHVYDKSSPVFTEEQRPKPNSMYGAMKYAQELLFDQAAKAGHIQAVIFRTGHIYGPKSRPFHNSAIATVCHKAHNNETIDLYGRGKVEFDLTYIDDVIEYIRRAIHFDFSKPTTILNLGSGFSHTIEEVVNILESHLTSSGGKKLARNYVDSPVQKNTISVTKLHQTLGTFQQVTLVQGLKYQLAFLPKNKEGTINSSANPTV